MTEVRSYEDDRVEARRRRYFEGGEDNHMVCMY